RLGPGGADEGAALPVPGDLLLLVGAAAGDVGGRVAEQGGADGAVADGQAGDAALVARFDEGGHHARGGGAVAAAGEDVEPGGRGSGSGFAVYDRNGLGLPVAVEVSGGPLGDLVGRAA